MNRGIALEVKRQINVIDFHAGHGFAGMSESLLRTLCGHLDWVVSSSPSGVDQGHHLAVAAMLHADPTLTEEEVVQ